MGLLSHNDLKQLVARKVIENCPLALINAASIDVTLGDTVMVENYQREMNHLDLRRRDAVPMQRLRINEKDGYVVRPGEFILAHSQQIFNLPNNIACEYKLKSSIARLGLNHALAGWCDPGWHGSVLTFEFFNILRYNAITIRPGDRIGQMIFFSLQPVPASASYEGKGRYNNDRTVHGVKP